MDFEPQHPLFIDAQAHLYSSVDSGVYTYLFIKDWIKGNMTFPMKYYYLTNSCWEEFPVLPKTVEEVTQHSKAKSKSTEWNAQHTQTKTISAWMGLAVDLGEE